MQNSQTTCGDVNLPKNPLNLNRFSPLDPLQDYEGSLLLKSLGAAQIRLALLDGDAVVASHTWHLDVGWRLGDEQTSWFSWEQMILN